MPRFKGGASGLSPLLVQLSTSDTGTVEVVGWYAGVAPKVTGSPVSRPRISRPSLIGTASSTGLAGIIGVSNPAAVSESALVTAFATLPSLPATSTYLITEPYDVQWAAAKGSGLIVLPGAAALLYAIGPDWNGQLEWSEP